MTLARLVGYWFAFGVLWAHFRGQPVGRNSWQVATSRRWRIRRHLLGYRSGEVVKMLQLLGSVSDRVVLIGGWGVDALYGRQTRVHHDLDVIVDLAHEADAMGTLERQGYRVERRDYGDEGALLINRVLLQDRHGRLVDMHFEVICAPLGFRGERRILPTDIVTGRVGGRPVPCLSASLQLAELWRWHGHDGGRDVARLTRLLAMTQPT